MQILRGHSAVVPALAFSPDGSLLAAAGNDGTARLWRFPAGAAAGVLERSCYSALSLAFSPDGRWLALPPVEAGVAARVWDLADRFRSFDLSLTGDPAVHQWPLALAFTPDGKHLVVTGQGGHGWNRVRYARVEALCRRWQVGTWAELPAGDFDIGAHTFWRQPWALSPA